MIISSKVKVAKAFHEEIGLKSIIFASVYQYFQKKSNTISEKGMAYLKKAQWQNMEQLLMSTLRMTKTIRLLEIKAVSG